MFALRAWPLKPATTVKPAVIFVVNAIVVLLVTRRATLGDSSSVAQPTRWGPANPGGPGPNRNNVEI